MRVSPDVLLSLEPVAPSPAAAGLYRRGKTAFKIPNPFPVEKTADMLRRLTEPFGNLWLLMTHKGIGKVRITLLS